MSPSTAVFLKLALIIVPFVVLARFGRIFPARPLIYLALVPLVVCLALVAWEWLLPAILALDAILAMLVIGDLATLPAAESFSATRAAGRVASLGKRHAVRLEISNNTRRELTLSVRDGVPQELHAKPATFEAIRLGPLQRVELDYELHPGRRGAFTLSTIHLQVGSRLGFWRRFLDYTTETELHVYPDMQQMGQYALLARTNRLSQLGVRRTRRIGQDHDFERLRDYTLDDNYKHIDWRTTARRNKLTVKDFQANQSQRVVFLLDCGRMMTNQAGGLSLLDHALNALLMLSHVALTRADSVGLICFSNEVHSHVPARGGMKQMNRLLHAAFDRFPAMVESRYDLAFRYLAAHVRKRSLVVLITNVIDEVNSNQIERYLTTLVGRHLPLGVFLRDRALFDAVDVQQPVGDALWRAAAAADILAWRRQTLADLAAKGALVMDVLPEQMTASLINRYLQIKARHLL